MLVLLRHVTLFILLLFLNFTINPYPIIGLGLYISFTVLSACASYLYVSRMLNRVEQRGRSGYIYAFTDIGSIVPAVKIGRESTQEQRLNAHRTAAPLGIIVFCNFYVPDAVAAEGYLHRRYYGQRLYSRTEWFVLTPRLFVELILLRLIRRSK